ncbi:MAG TPA: sialidase family protein [Candidatus Limnocylindrales bacterium]|nr:sialidase family protein [Candidatus Limnocylindrales bacterium]
MTGPGGGVEVLGQSVVYRNPYPGFRSRVASASSACWSRAGAPSGYLLCAFRLGEAKMSPDGRATVRASHDLGVTWVDRPSPLGSAGDGANEAGIHLGADSSGTTILAAARMRMAMPGTSDWSDEAAGIVDADAVVVRAAAGEGWAMPEILDHRRCEGEWAIACGPPLALGSSRWILPMERHARADRQDWLRRYHAFAALSDDDGRTWPRTVATLNDPDGRLAHYDQRMTLLGDGRLLTVAWVHDVVDDATRTARAGISDDGGATWSRPFDSGIVGGPINPITLRDSRILAVYNRRTLPTGVRASLSEDDGATWREEFVIYDEARRAVVGEPAGDGKPASRDPGLWTAMWGWTFGTPTPVELPDGSVAVTFFATGFDIVSAIHRVRLQP